MTMQDIHDGSWMFKAVKDALNIEKNAAESTEEIQKTALDINFTSGAVIGAMGGAVAGNKANQAYAEGQADAKYKQIYGNYVQRFLNENAKKLSDVNNDQYAQIQNLSADLKVMFTPFSTVYKVRNTVVDTIPTDQMNEVMKDAWKNKNYDFFKNTLVNKVYLDAQLAEQMFVKRLIENDRQLQGAVLNKDASEMDHSEEYFLNVFETLANYDYLDKLLKLSAESELVDKYTEALLKSASVWEDITIPFELGGCKNATDEQLCLGYEKLAVFGNSHIEVITPLSLRLGFDVSFLPDRVLFIKDNVVISQINVMEMNEDGYEHFRNHDVDYFKGLALKMAKAAGYEDFEIEKEAEDFGPEEDVMQGLPAIEKEALILDADALYDEVFSRDDIHPTLYSELLSFVLGGNDWKNFDAETMMDTIKYRFNVENVSPVAFDKIMFLIVLSNSTTPYDGYHTFEKMARAFNGKSVTFGTPEPNLSLGEILFALRVGGDAIKDFDENIYDNMSDEVFGYIAEMLADKGCRHIATETASEGEKNFVAGMNDELDRIWFGDYPEGLEGVMAGDKELTLINSLINEITAAFANIPIAKTLTEDVRAEVEKRTDGTEVDFQSYKQAVLNNVIGSIAVNLFLKSKEKQLEDQRSSYIA